MRQIFLIASMVVLLGYAVSFAQVAPASVSPRPAASVCQIKTALGKINSVVAADPATGAKAGISIVDANGGKMTFSVKPGAAVYDAGQKAISLGSLKKDQSVNIDYAVKDGVNEAVSISVK